MNCSISPPTLKGLLKCFHKWQLKSSNGMQILSRILEAVTKTRSFITDSFLLLLLCYFQFRKETEKVNKCIMIVFHYSAKYRHVLKLTDRNQNENIGTRQDNMNKSFTPYYPKVHHSIRAIPKWDGCIV